MLIFNFRSHGSWAMDMNIICTEIISLNLCEFWRELFQWHGEMWRKIVSLCWSILFIWQLWVLEWSSNEWLVKRCTSKIDHCLVLCKTCTVTCWKSTMGLFFPQYLFRWWTVKIWQRIEKDLRRFHVEKANRIIKNERLERKWSEFTFLWPRSWHQNGSYNNFQSLYRAR